jgi:hypothetical protein
VSRGPSYGTPNLEMIGRWLQLPPEEDGPFWAVNLMKYKAVASYADGRATTLSGREADEEYTPTGPLAAIGAVIAFAADVVEQSSGEPTWDRVGIVRYPSRQAFFAMQQRKDFQTQHEHKEAGMDVTIVLACHPSAGAPVEPLPADELTMRVERGGSPANTDALVQLDVEGVIVGDDRTWDRVSFGGGQLADATDADEVFTMVVRPLPGRHHLAETITGTPIEEETP